MIDDIDTLTTQGKEAGFDFFYKTLFRAKRKSKILYTQRNAPTHSLTNSIEVPGLSLDGEYQSFIEICCDQFNVPQPQKDIAEGKLSAISERRPLVIESIIALRRNSNDYTRAIQLFEQSAGDDVRKYVFQREWDALPADNYGRYLLAVISLYGAPMNFDDICVLTRYDESRVSGAIADTREMFLHLNQAGTETTYDLGTLTRSYIADESRKLDAFVNLKERVEKFKKNSYPENPLLSRLKARVMSAIEKSKYNDIKIPDGAWSLVNDKSLPPSITEDPRFLSLKGFVAASSKPPRLDDARQFFRDAIKMKGEPDIEHLRAWFSAERGSERGLQVCIEIADLVRTGRSYRESDKLAYLFKKASVHYTIGYEHRLVDPEIGRKNLIDSLECYLTYFFLTAAIDIQRPLKTDEYIRNTSYVLFDLLILNSMNDDFFALIGNLSKKKQVFFDPIEEPLIRAARMIERRALTRGEKQRWKSKIDNTASLLSADFLWQDKSSSARVVAAFGRSSQKMLPD